MSGCLFCQIIAGEIPSSKVYEDDLIYAFRDINPKAEVHVLVVPKQHLGSLEDLEKWHQTLSAHMLIKLKDIARLEGLEDGFRTIINTGPGGGQEVGHLHLHILGGEDLEDFT